MTTHPVKFIISTVYYATTHLLCIEWQPADFSAIVIRKFSCVGWFSDGLPVQSIYMP